MFLEKISFFWCVYNSYESLLYPASMITIMMVLCWLSVCTLQLLEQALVIEEQLRKASVENSSFVGPADAPSEEVGICDRWVLNKLSPNIFYVDTIRKVKV